MRLRPVLALAATLAFGILGAADLTITSTTSAKRLGEGTEVRYYTAAHTLTRNARDQRDTLVDFTKGATYTIDHKKKVIEMITFEDAFAALDALNGSLPEGVGGLMGAMFGDPNDVKVEKKGADKVAGRACEAWSIRVGKLLMEVSLDPTLRPPYPDTASARMVRAQAAAFAKAGPAGASFKRLYEEMAKLKGMPLKTHLAGLMGMDAVTEATRVETGPIPAATFELPTGYRLEDAGKKLRAELKAK
ncbi:DUF4412 domain-containing protein [Mesoterricola sediminis]|uniref:DUF4412 domain-containing protein n=1 Tax=Mesoterricola sediminis TaxID=2927980 RepID=A0AA48H377_9BACT|nr:DUF4412 domain-containing protein [Mesoterricola sediminis]BDU75178.1 hypothetical protein METESE_01360 [Mesoterricola sediminis]